MTASERLKKKLPKRGDQARAAAKLHVSEPTLSRLLAGTYTPSLALAARIEDTYGIPSKAWAA